MAGDRPQQVQPLEPAARDTQSPQRPHPPRLLAGAEEKTKILAFHDLYPLEGYRRLAYMMLDADIVAVSPSSVYRVLKAAGKLAHRAGAPSRKGTGFEQPLRPHEHWHVDV